MDISSHMLSRIGNTPLVRLSRVARDIDAEVLVKVEYVNPSGSLKDRLALRMIEDAEREGKLRPGMEIVEASTGNTATSLAFVGAVKGYPVHLFIPSNAVSEERLKIMKAYGATVTAVQVSADEDKSKGGLHGSIVEKTPRQVCLDLEQSSPNVWWARQFSNPGNAAAHADGTGREIIEQADGRVDAFVAAMNVKARSLGMADSRFVEPTGLSSENVASPRDLVKLVEAAHAYPMIREYSTREAAYVSVHGREVAYRNTNGLVRGGNWEIGLSKTGFISEAGRCLVMRANVAGKDLVLVLLDSWGRYSRIGDANRIRKWLETGPAQGLAQ